MDRVRFPFTFMALLAIAMGVWILSYVRVGTPTDPIAHAIAAGAGISFLIVGAYLLLRRVLFGRQA